MAEKIRRRGRCVLADILRAESFGQDLQESDSGQGIHVCAMLQDGTLYEVGSISMALAYQDPKAAMMAAERIKFSSMRKHPA
jgi:hypothetical protein